MLSAAQQQQLIPLNQSRYRFEYFMAKKEAAAALRLKAQNPQPQQAVDINSYLEAERQILNKYYSHNIEEEES